MTVSADALRKLAALSLAPEQMAGVLGIIADMSAAAEQREQAEAERKSKDKERKRLARSKDSPRKVQGQSVDIPEPVRAAVPPKEIPHTPLEITPSTSLRSDNRKEARASRIPEDFVPDMQAAYDAGLSEDEALIEVANFLDYWRAKSANATKRDWNATWRIWCHKAASQKHGGHIGQRVSAPNGKRPHDTIFRALAKASLAGPGVGERSPGVDAGAHGNGAAAAGDRPLHPDLDIPAFMRREQSAGNRH